MRRGFMHLAAGMSVGLTGVAAGYTIGVVGDAVRTCLQRPSEPLVLTGMSGCSGIHATIPSLCWNDFDLDFRRSPWSLWVGPSESDTLPTLLTCQLDCRFDLELQVLSFLSTRCPTPTTTTRPTLYLHRNHKLFQSQIWMQEYKHGKRNNIWCTIREYAWSNQTP